MKTFFLLCNYKKTKTKQFHLTGGVVQWLFHLCVCPSLRGSQHASPLTLVLLINHQSSISEMQELTNSVEAGVGQLNDDCFTGHTFVCLHLHSRSHLSGQRRPHPPS